MKLSVTASLSAMALATVFSVPVSAYEDVSGDDVAPSGGGFIGLGVISKPDYEGSEDNTTTAAPFGHYSWASGRFVSLGGSGGSESAARLRVNLIGRDTSEHWTLGPLLQYRLERDDDIDNRQVDRMKKVDAATELGAFVGYRSGPWAAETSFAGDVSDEHDGYIFYLKGSYDLMKTSTTTLTFGVNMAWADSDYMDTYFGVNPKNVGSSTLPFFKADEGVKNIGASITGLHRFNATWGVAANVSYNSMQNDAEDSPLVDGRQGVGDTAQVNGILAVIYSF